MSGVRQGSIRLFRFAGVDVFLHWSWFLVAVYEVNSRAGKYSSITWNVLEYLALFLIVLFHEYGHALACQKIGGRATKIVLWPLGGLAYVNPPPRPGATLFSIAAGPLVNVVLFPISFVLFLVIQSLSWAKTMPNAYQLVLSVTVINMVILVFNLLPIYPLDGGQIVRSLLWFVLGRARSLMVATLIGFVGVAGLLVYAFRTGSVWFGVMSVFIVLNCWAGLKQSITLLRLTKLPRRDGFACPWCKAAPPLGNYWKCGACSTLFDIFEANAFCPYCATQLAATQCLDCGTAYRARDWIVPAVSSPTV